MAKRHRIRAFIKWFATLAAGLVLGLGVVSLLCPFLISYSIEAIFVEDGMLEFQSVEALRPICEHSGWSAELMSRESLTKWPVNDYLWPTYGELKGYRTFLLPLWIPFAAFAGFASWFWYADRQSKRGGCRKCGYDLTGNVTGRCSECGAESKGEK